MAMNVRWCSCWLASALALTAVEEPAGALRFGPLQIAAGPWMSLEPDGRVTVSLRLVPPVDGAAVAKVRPRWGSAVLPVEPVQRFLSEEAGSMLGQTVVSWTLPPLTTGPVSLGGGARAPQVTVPVPLSISDAVRLVVVGGQGWPTAERLAAFSTQLGGTPHAALVLGSVDAGRVGSGGWESQIPLLTRIAPQRQAAAAQAILAPPPATVDAVIGMLGLPSLLRGESLSADCLGRPRPWNVMLDPGAVWDIGLRATAGNGRPDQLRLPLVVARLASIPLILAGGSACGFISEPMDAPAKGGIIPAVGGVRYLAATPSGEAVSQLPSAVAIAFEEPMLVGLVADASQLRVIFERVEGRPLILTWTRGDVDPGIGKQPVVPLVERWRTGGDAAVPDPGLLWVTRLALRDGEWSLAELMRLANAGGDDEGGSIQRLLARRLVADPWLVGDEVVLLRGLPPWLQREAILRWMAERDDGARAWVTVASTTADQRLVAALLTRLERTISEQGAVDPMILSVLVDRLRLQSEHALPLDADPMTQSRLTAAVFDRTELSPTPLRAIARALVDRLSPLGAKPVRRFIERHGAYRDANQD